MPTQHKRSNDIRELFPPKFDETGNRLCRFCGGSLPKGRTAWCSDDCNEKALIVCYPSFAREFVWRRDKGVCAKCGTHTEQLKQKVYDIHYRLLKANRYTAASKWLARYSKRGWPCSRWNPRSWWDADHTVPVVEGGGGCGLENYRTLCVPCHKAETKALAGRRAEAKRQQLSLGLQEAVA